jgi:hypothetical protein
MIQAIFRAIRPPGRRPAPPPGADRTRGAARVGPPGTTRGFRQRLHTARRPASSGATANGAPQVLQLNRILDGCSGLGIF